MVGQQNKSPFKRTRYEGINGKMRVKYEYDNLSELFYIDADAFGITLNGSIKLYDNKGLQQLAKAIGECYGDYLKLQDQMRKELRGIQ